jgi:hypothetical protein
MQFRFPIFLAVILVICVFMSFPAWGQGASQPKEPQGGDFSNVTNPDPAKVVPKGEIIVKGAWSGASDSVTPVPEKVSLGNNIFTDAYFGITYLLPANWAEKYSGPPPSDSGRYTLLQLRPIDSYKDKIRGHMEILAQDMFFTPFPAKNAVQLINYTKNHLQADYKLELPPTETKIGGQTFTFFSYWSPVAGLHWYVLATEIRCHTVQFVLTSSDTKLLESLVQGLDKMKLPAEASPTGGKGGGAVPVCIKDFANSDNLAERVNPVFTEQRFNPVPVRIVIDKEGKVKHIHFLSAFPEQERAITEALKKWKFRPYEQNGARVEVETGIMFGRAPRWTTPTDGTASTE